MRQKKRGREKEGKQGKQNPRRRAKTDIIGTILRGFGTRGRREYDTLREVVGSHDAKECAQKRDKESKSESSLRARFSATTKLC